MYAPPEFNRFSQYYEARLYGIGLLPSRPAIWCPWLSPEMSSATMWSMPLLRSGQLAHTGNFSITAAYYAPIVPGVRVGIGLGYTDHPTPVIYTPQTGSDLNLLANMVTYW